MEVYIYSKILFVCCSSIQACQSYKILSLKQINNSVLCRFKATATQIYWQELLADKKILFSSDLQATKVFFYAAAMLLCHSAAFLCYFFHKISASGSKFFIMYFFALISNPESELKNLRRVFFNFHFNFYISNCELTK